MEPQLYRFERIHSFCCGVWWFGICFLPSDWLILAAALSCHMKGDRKFHLLLRLGRPWSPAYPIQNMMMGSILQISWEATRRTREEISLSHSCKFCTYLLFANSFMAAQFGLADESNYDQGKTDSGSLMRISLGPSFFTNSGILTENYSWCNWTFGFLLLAENWNQRKKGYLQPSAFWMMTSEIGHNSSGPCTFIVFLVIGYLVEIYKILCPVELVWIFHNMLLFNLWYLSLDFLILKSNCCLCLSLILCFWPPSQDPQWCLELLGFHFSVAARMTSSVSLLSYFFVNCPKPAYVSSSASLREDQTPCRYWNSVL